VEAEDVVCGAETTSKSITIDNGDSFFFKTQKSKKYTKNVDCTVDYKLGSSCDKMSFICTKFNTNNKDKKRCSKGDKVTITANGKTRVFCKLKKPKVFSMGDMKVVFTSDAEKHATGGTCSVKCAQNSQSGSTAVSAEELRKKPLTEYPLAKCNDGSTASFYASSNVKTSQYLLIHLQGGGLCGSMEDCKKRCKGKGRKCTTQKGRTMTRDITSFSSDPEENPAFHNFGKIYVPYCSSDVYTGTRNFAVQNAKIKRFYFHGRHIIDAVGDAIIKDKPDIGSLKQVVFMGTSAGAAGVTKNCDFLAEKFKRANPNIDFRCISDGGDFRPPVAPIAGCNPEEKFESMKELWQPQGDSSCAASVPDNSFTCGRFHSSYNYIETPFMVVGGFIDYVTAKDCSPPLSKENQQFWDNYKIEAEAMARRFIQDKPGNAIFLANCVAHVFVNQDTFWNDVKVKSASGSGSLIYKNVVNNWLTGSGPYQAIDDSAISNNLCPKPKRG